MKGKKLPKANLLEGYQRRGKRLVPPLMQLPSLDTSVSYVRDMLPELLWIGLVNQRVGYVRSARILEKVFRIVQETTRSDPERNFALISAFDELSDDERAAICRNLNDAGILPLLQSCVAPLNLLYDRCPLLFLGHPEGVVENADLVSAVKNCVNWTSDKYKTPGIVLNMAVLIFLLVTERIALPPDLPDFNAVVNAPESEEAQFAAGILRSIALTEFGQKRVSRSWARRFWNRNYQLSPCEFGKREDFDVDSAEH